MNDTSMRMRFNETFIAKDQPTQHKQGVEFFCSLQATYQSDKFTSSRVEYSCVLMCEFTFRHPTIGAYVHLIAYTLCINVKLTAIQYLTQ